MLETAASRKEEAALTGESVPIGKATAPPHGEPIRTVGDRKNMAYKGTSVAYGRGRGLVVATGMATELGKIAALLSQEAEVKTPLQKRLAESGGSFAIVALVICGSCSSSGSLAANRSRSCSSRR